MVATDALWNQDADIWLMDMDEEEIAARLRYRAKPEEIVAWRRIDAYVAEHNAQGLRLWEEGLKQEALDYFNGGTELMRRTFPTLWQVLIHERNLLMASRLIFITEEYINMGIVEPRILAIVGAAHVPGMRRLLVDPLGALRLMEQSNLQFTPPVRIHKVRVS
jgi:pheromone shutdown protein TraB